MVLRTILFLLFMIDFIFAQTTIVQGKLLDANNKPSKYALVGILEDGEQRGKNFVSCDEKGNYKIILTKPIKNILLFSMPSHSSLIIPIVNNKDKKFTLDVRLEPYKYKSNFDEVSLSGAFNNYNHSSTKMIKQKDGSYKYEIETDEDEIRFQLCNIEKNRRTINAPKSVSYKKDSSGDYFSIVKVKDGKAIIVFNPNDLLRKDVEKKVSVTGSEYDKKIIEATFEYNKIRTDAVAEIKKYMKANKSLNNFHYDRGNYFINFSEKINMENDRSVKDYLKLIYISYSDFKPKGYDSSTAIKYFESLAPTDYVWDLIPNSFSSLHSLLDNDRLKEVQEKFLKESTSDMLKSTILLEKLMFAKYSTNKEEYKSTHKCLETEYGHLKWIKKILKMYPLESKIEVGAIIPDFEVVSIDNKKEKFSKKSMFGKIYMIDFWATWCGPCVGEMKSLHNAYSKFKDKGFEIISLSSDRSAEVVLKFRGEKWKMPWKNSLLKGAEGKKIQADFEVSGIPKPILVGADGKILAMPGKLRGEKLEKTLSKYFK